MDLWHQIGILRHLETVFSAPQVRQLLLLGKDESFRHHISSVLSRTLTWDAL